MPTVGRVDALDPLPDRKIAADAAAYLENHQIDKLLGDILEQLLLQKPADPAQYIIDILEHGSKSALQDTETGLSQWRKDRLVNLFNTISQSSGGINISDLKNFTSKSGVVTMSNADLTEVFNDLDTKRDNLVSLDEFMLFFSKVSKACSNREFENLLGRLESEH